MIKVVPHNAWTQFSGESHLEQIKVASTGLRGRDFAEFVKLASHPLAVWVADQKPDSGEVWVHKIAMYSTEVGGANRNFDTYGLSMLERDHPSFEKYARFYMDHQNRDPRKSYGLVKKAYLNKDLGRVELIVALNATKQAAERNGGLVAESTLNKLANNVDVAVSQSCRVPGDYCSGCGHFARNRAEYCTPMTCKYGGCRDNLGRVFDDGHQQTVDNRDCTFFDISDVSRTRGADRGSFITGKIAASDHEIGGAELAEMLGLVSPEHLLDPATLSAVSSLRKIASAPAVPHAPASSWDDCLEVRARKHHGFTKQAANPTSDPERHQLIAELAGDGVILPPGRWLSLMTGAPVEKCAALFTGGVHPQRLLDRNDLHDRLSETNYGNSRISPPGSYSWMSPTIKSHAEESAYAVISGPAKHASVESPANVREEAELRYLAYQAAVLAKHAHSPQHAVLVMECVRHNQGRTF